MPTIIKARVACSAPEVVRGRKTSNTEVDTARERFFFCLFHEAEQKGLCVLYCKNSKRFCKLHQTSWLSLNFVKFKENSSWNRNPGDTQERRHTKDLPHTSFTVCGGPLQLPHLHRSEAPLLTPSTYHGVRPLSPSHGSLVHLEPACASSDHLCPAQTNKPVQQGSIDVERDAEDIKQKQYGELCRQRSTRMYSPQSSSLLFHQLQVFVTKNP